jgi:hypothetical protein
MQDLETESLWSQISGECISGSQIGSKLKQFPAIHSTYKEFKKNYPNGLLLKKPEKGEVGSQYISYFDDKEKLGIFGRSNSFTRLDGKDKVIGIRVADREIAVSYEFLAKEEFVVISDSGGPIIIIFNVDGATVSAFILDLADTNDLKSLDVTDHIISIAGGKMKWDAYSGHAFSMGVNNLEIKPAMTAFWFAWISFFPETELIN